MSNLPIVESLTKTSNHFFTKVREAFSPMEDQWTLTTQDGRYFEGVEVENIEATEVVIQHKHGESRVPISRLSDDSRQMLVQTGKLSLGNLQAA